MSIFESDIWGRCRDCGVQLGSSTAGHGFGICNKKTDRTFSESEVKELLTGLLKEIESCDQYKGGVRLSDIRTIFNRSGLYKTLRDGGGHTREFALDYERNTEYLSSFTQELIDEVERLEAENKFLNSRIIL